MSAILTKANWEKQLLKKNTVNVFNALFKFIPWARLGPLAGHNWPTGHMLDTPALEGEGFKLVTVNKCPLTCLFFSREYTYKKYLLSIM